MTDFLTMDKEAHAAKTPSDKIRIYREITKRAQVDSEFRSAIDYERFMNSNRAFMHLLAKEPQGSGLKIAILGYKVPLMGKWDPFDTVKGLPGSEECAVYASQELAKRGHRVTLYMNPPDESIWKSPFSNPRWLPEDLFHVSENKDYYDLVLMWRRFDVNTGRKRSKTVFLWPHDSPNQVPRGTKFPGFDGICFLSEHQRRQFIGAWSENKDNDVDISGLSTIPYAICGNGILLEHFENPVVKDNPYSIGYFSNYARGLIILILLWPEIKNKYPMATLDIYYGRETWNTISPQHFQLIIDKISEYKDFGVTEHGKVGHLPLAEAMKRTSILAYPCTAAGETWCISLVKAQAAGMIPVITRIGALAETGHPEAPSLPLINNNSDIIQYKNLLFETLDRITNTDSTEIIKERQKYIDFAKQFTWIACVDKWLELYNRTNCII